MATKASWHRASSIRREPNLAIVVAHIALANGVNLVAVSRL
jgi:hypothetical protein